MNRPVHEFMLYWVLLLSADMCLNVQSLENNSLWHHKGTRDTLSHVLVPPSDLNDKQNN